MHEHERIRSAPCGCLYDVVTGLGVQLCAEHRPTPPTRRRAVRWADFLAYAPLGERRPIWGTHGAEAEILDRVWHGQGAGQIGDRGVTTVTVLWPRDRVIQRWRRRQGYVVPRRDGSWGWGQTRWELIDERKESNR